MKQKQAEQKEKLRRNFMRTASKIKHKDIAIQNESLKNHSAAAII